MTDDRFSELVSLYLDNELSPRERRELNAAVSRCPELRRRFEQYVQLHGASRMALGSPPGAGGAPASVWQRLSPGLAWAASLVAVCGLLLQFESQRLREAVSPSAREVGRQADHTQDLSRLTGIRFETALPSLPAVRASRNDVGDSPLVMMAGLSGRADAFAPDPDEPDEVGLEIPREALDTPGSLLRSLQDAQPVFVGLGRADHDWAPFSGDSGLAGGFSFSLAGARFGR